MQRVRKYGLVALTSLALLVLGVSAAYALDQRAHRGEVARNVRVAGRDVGGLRPAQVRAEVVRLARRVPGAAVTVTVDGKRAFATTAGELGARVDVDESVDRALRAGRSGAIPGRVASWLRSFVSPRTAALAVDVDAFAAHETVARLDDDRRDPVEPSIEVRDGSFVAVAGKPGRGIDARDVAAELPDALAGGSSRVELDVERGPISPRFGIDRARALARRAEGLVESGLRVRAGDATATVPAKRLRTWLSTRAGRTDLALAIDPEKAADGLAELLPKAGKPPVDAGFRVNEAGSVEITPAAAGTACCGAEAPDRIMAALLAGTGRTVELPLETVPPRRTVEEARKLGIVERVATFTTNHKCCEPRVTNIHRIADILRGYVIEPGETFSVNKTVGRRTREKGFVSAPVIENGQHAEDVGGGISQWATTSFNAAFFAGLEFGEYQSHSLYISRYPYGREATMGYPHPDLEIKNVTPYGILVWPTYTSTSLTVNLYSTRYFRSVEQVGQSKSTRGTCTVVRTERRRVWPDGTARTDAVFATYRAEEGLNCDGTRAPAPSSSTSRPRTTTPPPTSAPPPPTSSPPASAP